MNDEQLKLFEERVRSVAKMMGEAGEEFRAAPDSERTGAAAEYSVALFAVGISTYAAAGGTPAMLNTLFAQALFTANQAMRVAVAFADMLAASPKGEPS